MHAKASARARRRIARLSRLSGWHGRARRMSERLVTVAQHVVRCGSTNLRVETEESAEESNAAFTWPCARVLAHWVLSERAWLAGKTVLELGAGTALPGLVAAFCGARVTLTDQDEAALRAARASAALNGLSCAYVPLAWGDWAALAAQPSADLVLGSDVLYERDDTGILPTFIARHAADAMDNREDAQSTATRMGRCGSPFTYQVLEVPHVGDDNAEVRSHDHYIVVDHITAPLVRELLRAIEGDR